MSIREVIMDYLENSSKKALSVEELSVALHMNKAKDYKVFVKTLASLEAEHLLHFTAKGKVELAEQGSKSSYQRDFPSKCGWIWFCKY
ncbi:hypothetical protein [Lactococcus cremoris]|uniref:hypothetical protein n=1 Tax=Lactococcus lactis subsp. cremoris TaxID=1359 RepID=UPI002912A655|nr:hypothetical protein [Lactococcus cremoris]MDU8932628.1 hypothetical protein [Lactococcus cremoris]